MKKMVAFLLITACSSFILPAHAKTEIQVSQSVVSPEKLAIEDILKKIKDKSFFEKKLQNIVSMLDRSMQADAYADLSAVLKEVYLLQTDLDWLNLDAIKAALDDMKKNKDFDCKNYEIYYQKLRTLNKQGFDEIYKGDKTALLKARKALKLKRKILLGNPLLDKGKIVAVRYNIGSRARNIMTPQLGTQPDNWSNQSSALRTGFDAEIIEISNLQDDTLKMRAVYKQPNSGSIADLKLHWDGKRVMFTTTRDDKRWNLFEVGLNSGKCTPLMEMLEDDMEFYDGAYLPDGRIIATTNIGYQGVSCVGGDAPVGNMVLYDPKNKDMRRLTFDQDANWNPTIMHNGRIMYTRWEYTDLMHYYSRFVMHMNPDGTEQKALYGSGSMFPNSTFDMQPLPNHPSAFIGVISGHHGTARSGRLILFDPTKGRANVDGMLQEIPHSKRQIVELVKDHLVAGVWPQFIKPSPIDDKYFLVAAKLNSGDLWGIYLVDIFDNVTCLHKVEGEGYISPILVRKTTTPPSIPDRVKLEEKEATVFIQDIYEGEGLPGIPKGTVKSLRLHAYEYCYVHRSTSGHDWHGIQSGWDIKRQLGTVPVEEDGSVIFKVPANTPISIQPLDKNGAAVQLMRSWFTGMPGEVVSCVGCHEDQNKIPKPKRVIASQREPHKITPPEGGVRPFTFDLEVQPILDRACVACHNGDKAFDLQGGKKEQKEYGLNLMDYHLPGNKRNFSPKQHGFSLSYLNLHPYVHRQGSEADMAVLVPYEYHVNTSELIQILKRGHANVKLTGAEWQTLYTWIDYNVPYKGYFEANPIIGDLKPKKRQTYSPFGITYNGPYQGYDQIIRRKKLADKYACGMGVDWKKELADYASHLKGKGEIKAELPDTNLKITKRNFKVKNWPIKSNEIKKMLANEKKIRKTIVLDNSTEMTFVRIPAGQFLMGSSNGSKDNSPISKVKIKKAFWMAEIEVTNQQYNVLRPDHDSRSVDQLWKDHVHAGYPANKPEQPVIRVSYNDVIAWCNDLSAKTGLKITLPSEAQWEWACRAGSDNDFWYGDLSADFSKKDNLADESCNKMAVIGVDPHPMKKTDIWYKYYSFLPKEERVNDGAMIQVNSKNYEVNPFGLYTMHGNIAEWTLSDYISYPYSEKSKKNSDHKVVRGGSYIERPKYSTAYQRKAYYPHQRIFNVGFRPIIED